jgi:3D (Asp-Asp-Asp) domain-containing protein
MKIKRIVIFAVEILLLILTIIQLLMIRDLRATYEKTRTTHAEKIEEKEIVFIPTKVECEINRDEMVVDAENANEEEKPLLIGNFKLTAYCSCYECCDEYALNRPVDENGNEIVYGAIGEVLTEGYSIAVDPDVIPYGTEVIIDGATYKAQDCGGAIDGNEIDVYFADHKKAQEFAVQYKDVYLKG